VITRLTTLCKLHCHGLFCTHYTHAPLEVKQGEFPCRFRFSKSTSSYQTSRHSKPAVGSNRIRTSEKIANSSWQHISNEGPLIPDILSGCTLCSLYRHTALRFPLCTLRAVEWIHESPLFQFFQTAKGKAPH